MTTAERDIRRKLTVLRHVESSGNVSKSCRFFGISRETFYQWKRAYQARGEEALVNRPPGARENWARRTPRDVEEKIFHLRQTYHFGPRRIAWYLHRYHGVRITGGGAYQVLRRQGLNRLPRNQRKRAIVSFRRYEKQVPGHQVQVDVKFLNFVDAAGQRVRRFQYTAVDDATRIRALRIYPKHNQATAIGFVDHVVKRFPFRIRQIRTDRGHEFQELFHWHVEDLGIEHVYIRPRTPRLNGKVERSHRTDQEEFYQLLTYTDDVDLNRKLEEWERFYNLSRPHGAFAGKTPYEVLRAKLC